MTDAVRVFTDSGIEKFREYLASLRSGNPSTVPGWLLTDAGTSEPFDPPMSISCVPARKPFTDRYEFGVYLKDRFSSSSVASISMDYRLWSWLALYYFEELCPADSAGNRTVLADEAYILDRKFKFEEYYRHLVRTPWLAVCQHGDRSRVLLIPASTPGSSPLSRRGEIIEQLAARQKILGNPAIVAGAYRMYFDETKGRPKRGSGGSGPGSPRRLALLVQQLELTYDLAACSPNDVVGLLPKEFERWGEKPAAASAD